MYFPRVESDYLPRSTFRTLPYPLFRGPRFRPETDSRWSSPLEAKMLGWLDLGWWLDLREPSSKKETRRWFLESGTVELKSVQPLWHSTPTWVRSSQEDWMSSTLHHLYTTEFGIWIWVHSSRILSLSFTYWNEILRP